MKMKFEKYFRPTTVQEALDLLKEYGNDCKIVAGGTDVVIRLRMHALRVKTLIDISRIEELKELKIEEGKLTVGATYPLMKLSKNEEVRNSQWEILAECAGHVSSTQVRNVATLGGNNVNASPSADTTPALLMLDAIVNAIGPNGKREIPIGEFLVGPGRTSLEQGEIVTGFTFPAQEYTVGAAYYKHAIRGDTDIAIVNVGALIGLDADRKVNKARVVLGAVAPKSLRVSAVEDFLMGKELTDDVIAEAAKLGKDSIKPISDQRATAEYRSEMCEVGLRHMIREAADKIK
jgi:CO/xanthine dehydrogenase FAD-binding subunit